jgi:hypothetical protein
VKAETAVRLINKLCDEQKFSKSRVLILEEWEKVTEFKVYQKLNENAQQFVKIIQQEKENNSINLLSDNDKKILVLMNQSIRDLRLPYAKRLYTQYTDLIERPDAQNWLTSDARFFCMAWKNDQQKTLTSQKKDKELL